MIWFGAVCDLLAGRLVSTTGRPSIGSVAGLEELQTPSLAAAWQFVLGSKIYIDRRFKWFGIRINLLFNQ